MELEYCPERIKDPLPLPTACNICGSEVRYVNNKEIYGSVYGRWPFSWWCQNKACGATVGCHPGTRIPLGTLADRPTKRARIAAHNALDPLWQSDEKVPKKINAKRRQIYSWLASQLQIPMADCHIGMFDITTCQRVVELCRNRKGNFP